MSYDPAEQWEIEGIFNDMLKGVTHDGAAKRASGSKVSWKVDPDHLPAVFSHLNRWFHGDLKDPDSGVHPLVHAAWRLLALAWQDEHEDEFLEEYMRDDMASPSDGPDLTDEQLAENLAQCVEEPGHEGWEDTWTWD